MDCNTQLPQKRFLLKKTDKLWSVYDFLAGSTACFLGLVLTPWSSNSFLGQHWWLILVYGLLVFLCAKIVDLPNPSGHSGSSIYETVVFSLMSSTMAIALLAVIQLIFSYSLLGRYVMAIAIFSSWIFLCFGRILAGKLIPPYRIGVVLIGDGDLAQSMFQRLQNSSRFKVCAFWAESQRSSINDLPVISPTDLPDAAQQLNEVGAQIVIICMDDNDPVDIQTQQTLVDLPLHGFYILNKGAFIEKYFAEISAEYMSFHWTTSFFAMSASSQTFTLKRVMDICISLFGLTVTLPLYPLIALAIKLDSSGGVFFCQKRVGYLGKHFHIIKFRTMGTDAEKDGAQWAKKNDVRVTRLGKLLRLSRVDELPQLWNVLRGDMSIVGPRPERPEFVSDLMQEIPYYERRHLVPPGLTGWAQICYRYGASKDDARKKLQFDLYYIKHLSILLDIKIILKTLPMIAKGSR